MRAARLVEGESLQARLVRARAAHARANVPPAAAALRALSGRVESWARESFKLPSARARSSSDGGDGGGATAGRAQSLDAPPPARVPSGAAPRDADRGGGTAGDDDADRLSMVGALELSVRLAQALEWLHGPRAAAHHGEIGGGVGARVALLHRDLKVCDQGIVTPPEERASAEKKTPGS